MSTIRKHPYQSRGEVDHLEELTAKLSADLRSNVRFMVSSYCAEVSNKIIPICICLG
jgi:hypothetical protein